MAGALFVCSRALGCVPSLTPAMVAVFSTAIATIPARTDRIALPIKPPVSGIVPLFSRFEQVNQKARAAKLARGTEVMYL